MRDEAKVRWSEQIDRQIESRNFTQAASLLREAQAEFPGDPELEEMAKQIRQAEERNAGTQALVDQARAFCVHGRFDEAATLLRKAYEADERDSGVRGQLVETLVQHARSLLDKNWKRAGELAQSALDLDPANTQARSLSALIADKKRDEAIEQCVNRARQSQASGDVAGALATVEQMLVFYPAAPRLLQLKSTLERSTTDGGRILARRQDLEKLTQLEARSETATDTNEQREILAGIRALAAKHLDDPDFQTALIGIEKRYVNLSRVPVPPTSPGSFSFDAPTLDPRNLESQGPPAFDDRTTYFKPPLAPPPPPPPDDRTTYFKPPLAPPPPVPPAAPPDDRTSYFKPPLAPPPPLPPATPPDDRTSYFKPPAPPAPFPPAAPPSYPPAAPPSMPPAAPPPQDRTSYFKAPPIPSAVVKPPETKVPETRQPDTKAPVTKPPVVPLPPPASSPGTRDFTAPPETRTPETLKFADPPKAPPAADPWAGPVPPFPPGSKPPGGTNWKLWGAGVAGFILVLAIAAGAVMWFQRQQGHQQTTVEKAGATFPVEVKTVPDGATIQIDDKPAGTSNLQLKLAAGTYKINAVKEGYRATQSTLTVAAGGATASANLVLQAMPTTLRILTDFASASIAFDGKPQTNLQSGQLIVDNVTSGPHTLTIGSGASGAAINFEARDGAAPVVTNLAAVKDTSAILITNLGPNARVYSSQKAGALTLDGKPAGALDPQGVELSNVAPGDHEITIGEGDDHRKIVYETAQVPALTVYLNNQQSVGTLLITTGEDDVRVFINGQPTRVTTRRGQMRIPNLPVKQYVIGVSKDGFQTVAEQRVTVKKGEEAKAIFQMRPVPAIATLHIAGAMPGTQVLVDNKPVGTVAPDGTMPVVQVSPGGHSVQLHKDEYKTKNFQMNFAAGKDVTLANADVTMEAAYGTLVVAVNPAGAQITVQRSGEAQARTLSANSVHLPEGSYTVTATSPHFVTQSASVEIALGSTRNLNLQLAPERVAAPPKTAVRLGMSGWQFPAAWQPDGDHFTRKGGNLCLYTPQGPGTYSFTASMKRGKQLRWVAHVVNDRNYVEFELDNENFYRRQVVDGKGRELIKRKHGIAMPNGIGATIQTKISPTGIVQSIRRGDGWAVLDSWMDPALHEGRFGFLIKGRDEVNLSAFWFAGSE